MPTPAKAANAPEIDEPEVDEIEEEVDETDPDDAEVDIDSDEDDEDVDSEDLHVALGGPKKPTRRDLKDPLHGAKYRTLLRGLKTTRKTAKEKEAEIEAARKQLETDRGDFETHKQTWVRDMAGRFKAVPKADVKADPKGAKPGQPVAAGKGAVQPAGEAKGFQLPQSEEELDALLAARLAKLYGNAADQDEETRKAAAAEQAKVADANTATQHNAWAHARWQQRATKEHGALLTKAAKEVYPTVFTDFRDDFVANQPWFSEFCVLLAEHPAAQGVYNTFARVPRGPGLFKRKPADVVRDLEQTGRQWGLIENVAPARGLPKPVIESRQKAGKPLNADLTRDELLQIEKTDPDRFLALLRENEALLDLLPERWEVESE